jgi:DNA-binding SARP family transcriptional activator
MPLALAAAAQLSAADPLSDRGCWLHVLALYRAGRTSDSLDAYTRHAPVLDDELGLQPGVELRELQTATRCRRSRRLIRRDGSNSSGGIVSWAR